MSSSADYQAKADEALAQLADATTEAERARLRRSHSAYVKLAGHEKEAADRAAARPPKRIVPEKRPTTKVPTYFD
jgi:hypothetical protein